MANSASDLHVDSSLPGVEDSSPILEKREVLGSQVEEGDVRARKCKCGLVWCESCSKLKWAKRHGRELSRFDHRRTREVILGIDRELFRDGEEAWRHVSKHKLVPGFIRNLERGKRERVGKKWVVRFKPLQITNWMVFLEWHKDGYPHWHVFVEVENEGAAGRIGNEMLRHYWPLARWVREHFFRSEAHWRNQTGYFQKNGYFHKNKKHQTRLPEWAMNKPGIRIRRSGGRARKEGSLLVRLSRYFKRKCDITVDLKTGEVLWWKGPKRAKCQERTYRERLELCGQRTWMRILTTAQTIQGVFDIPYREIRSQFEGEYLEGIGYSFKAARATLESFLSKRRRIEELNWGVQNRWVRERKGLLSWKWCLNPEPVA